MFPLLLNIQSNFCANFFIGCFVSFSFFITIQSFLLKHLCNILFLYHILIVSWSFHFVFVSSCSTLIFLLNLLWPYVRILIIILWKEGIHMEYKFQVQLTTGKIFTFLFFNAYTSPGAIISLALALILIFFGVFKGGWVYSFFGILFLITAPIVLFVRAFRDIHRKNSPYKAPMEYIFSRNDVRISQSGQQAVIPWNSFTDALVTSAGISLYTAKSAYIIPKADVGSCFPQLVELLESKLTVRRLFSRS